MVRVRVRARVRVRVRVRVRASVRVRVGGRPKYMAPLSSFACKAQFRPFHCRVGLPERRR